MCLLYKTLYTNDVPVYMSSMVSQYTPGRALRSASATMRLSVPRTRLDCADRCFSVSAPAFWNALPPHLHHCSTLQTFKTNLKTHLLRQHFSQILIFYVTVFLSCKAHIETVLFCSFCAQ